MSELVTGEAVSLELRLARFPSRALAIAIDLLVLGAVGVPLGIAIGFALAGADPALQAALVLAGVVALLVGVPVTVETLTRGRSLGKLALGLRVVRDDGGPIRFRHALVRGLAGVFADFWVTSGAGAVISSLLSSQGKRIGDLLAGTIVVRERAPSTGAAALPAPPPGSAAWASTLELSRLPDGLALEARSYLTRLHQLAPATREAMGARLASAVAGYVSPPPPPGVPAWAYLATVLAERHRRAMARAAGPGVPGAQGATVPATPPHAYAAVPPAASAADRPPTPGPGGFVPPT